MLFRPRYTIDTIYHLDPKHLKKMVIKAVFSDLDNTLLAWNKADTAVEMDQLNERLAKDGIRLVVQRQRLGGFGSSGTRNDD